MHKFILLGLFAAFISSCGGSSNNSSSTTGLKVLAASGATVDVTGVWSEPCRSALLDIIPSYTFSGSNVKLTINEFSSSNGTCAGASTEIASFSAEFSVVGEGITAGWVDGNSVATTAPVATGGGLLPANAVTILRSNIIEVTGTFVGGGVIVGETSLGSFYIDDTSAILAVYGSNNVSTTNAVTFIAANTLTKQ